MEEISSASFVNELRRYILEKIRDGLSLNNVDILLIKAIKTDKGEQDGKRT